MRRLLLLATLLSTILLLGCTGDSETASVEGEADTREGASPSEDIHPHFALTPEEFSRLLTDLPSKDVEDILADPEGFLDLAAELLRGPTELLLLVDKEHPLPAEYAPEDLVDLETLAARLTLTQEGLALRELVMEDLFAMVEQARAEGIELPITSTYRSYQYQAWLFDYWVEELGLEEAERSSARPGTSQHQLGTTIDFGSVTDAFAESKAGKWLAQNARTFGFSLSYPEGYEELTGYKYESWHFRYIGRPATRMQWRFFGGIQQRMLQFWNDNSKTLRDAYTGDPDRKAE